MSLRDDYEADALSRDVSVLCPACGEPADSNVFPCDACAARTCTVCGGRGFLADVIGDDGHNLAECHACAMEPAA